MPLKDKIPTYDQALDALEKGNDETLTQAIFVFKVDDIYYVGCVAKVVRGLLQRPNLNPKQTTAIARVLHGLERLPLRTPGIDVHLSLVDKLGEDVTSYELFLTEDTFSTQSGGIAGSGFDRDSFNGPTFRVESGSREYDGFDISDERWPDIFGEMKLADLQVTDNSDDSLLDWEHPDGSDFWQWIADHD